MTWKGSLFDTCCYTVRPVRFLVRHYGIEPGFEWLLYVENLTKDISTFEKFEGLSIQLDFFLQILFKDEFNFSVYVGYDWIVHLYAHIIAASLPVFHDLTYLFHTKVPTPWNVGDTMQCCLLQKYGVIFTGRQSKAISLHSNFSTFWVESHFMGYMLTLSIQLKV